MGPDQRLRRVVDQSAVPRTAEGYREWWEENTDVSYGHCWFDCGQQTTISTKTVRKHKWFTGKPKRWVRGRQNAVRPVSGS